MMNILKKLQGRNAGPRHTVHLRLREPARPQPKMADVLLDFAEPFLEGTTDDKSWKAALSLAVLAWNIALEPEDHHDRLIQTQVQTLAPAASNPAALAYLQTTLKTLTQRKQTHFPNIHQAILTHQVINEGPTARLVTHSQLDPKPS